RCLRAIRPCKVCSTPTIVTAGTKFRTYPPIYSTADSPSSLTGMLAKGIIPAYRPVVAVRGEPWYEAARKAASVFTNEVYGHPTTANHGTGRRMIFRFR